MSRELKLLRRLESNIASYHKLIKSYKKREIIRMAGEIAQRNELFEFLTDGLFELKQEAIDQLLCFANPLAAVTDIWREHQIRMGGYDDVVDFVAVLTGLIDSELDDDCEEDDDCSFDALEDDYDE